MRRVVVTLAVLCLLVLTVWPFHDRALKLGLPLSLYIVWAELLRRGWKRKGLRAVLLVLPFVAVAPFCLPGRSMDTAALRGRYLAAMKDLEGTRYVWGGECSQGIDCSGLPRRGLRVALLEEGWRHANGAAFREWMRQWWFDESAKAMSEGYRGFTRPTGVEGILRHLDLKDLQPGDLAVNSIGSHVMIYYGDGKWIQADPGPAKVFLADPKDFPDSWFDSKVTMHRWTLLE
ncbi:MAG: cell wall-associated hydrolase, invasion-associated protein [Akkermansiaceae bacterium]|nr:cell wall-associated hydrolase, invasion-associated protein [Akkermansiaceae bacterium]